MCYRTVFIVCSCSLIWTILTYLICTLTRLNLGLDFQCHKKSWVRWICSVYATYLVVVDRCCEPPFTQVFGLKFEDGILFVFMTSWPYIAGFQNILNFNNFTVS
jgi:hypothetical protein